MALLAVKACAFARFARKERAPSVALREAMAVLEIWMATRPDSALNAALAPVFAGVRARGTKQADAMMDASGAPSGLDALGLQTMMLATLRGLAIERALTGDPSTHDAAEHLAVFAGRLTAKP